MRVWQPPGCPQGMGKGLKQMRGFGVKLSPDSPDSDAMKTRTEPGNPGARFTTNYSYLQVIASGKPTRGSALI